MRKLASRAVATDLAKSLDLHPSFRWGDDREEEEEEEEVSTMQIRQATIADLDALVPLFDAYRQFYAQPSDLRGARAFLSERFERQQSTIFLALDEAGPALGFAQLYPSFTSTRMQRIFILNDLYVAPQGRRQGVAAALLAAAADHGRQHGAARLMLSTAIDNLDAQRVYEANGWVRDTAFHSYNLALP